MPISEYYGGHGEEVMRSMKKQYGPEKGERVFYATANKEGQTADDDDCMDLKRIVDAAYDDYNQSMTRAARSAGAVKDGWSETASETEQDIAERKDESGRFEAHASADLAALKDLVLGK